MWRLSTLRRPPRRRAPRPGWRQRWRAFSRSRLARWLLATVPVLLLLALLVLAEVAPSGQDLTRTWELVGKIGVVIATVLIARAMLTMGRWF
jgi:hypothetical protein